MNVISLPYLTQAISYFELLKDEPWAVFLDSGYEYGNAEENQRFDIITAAPEQTLVYENNIAKVLKQGNTIFETQDVYQAMASMLAQIPTRQDDDFFGGLIGYLSYDLGNEFYQPQNKGSKLMPAAVAGLYKWCLVVDHNKKTTQLRSWDRTLDLTTWQKLFTKKQAKQEKNTIKSKGIKHFLGIGQYKTAIAKIKCYLKEGDCYQVNFSQKFSIKTLSESFALYKTLRETNKVPFGAYLNYPFAKVLSFSPECFLTCHNNKVASYPIKGTVQRVKDKVQDKKLIMQLAQSDKDKAENLMIVDLTRNDLGKVCNKGSIQVPELFKIKSFRYVHHMQSKIIGQLNSNESTLSLLKNCFPGGSITGAPKKRAMEIIDELENHNREIYCGSIFYMTNEQMVSNIAIRTAIHKDNELFFWAGGGIVNDSEADLEYQESLDKAKVFTSIVDRG